MIDKKIAVIIVRIIEWIDVEEITKKERKTSLENTIVCLSKF